MKWLSVAEVAFAMGVAIAGVYVMRDAPAEWRKVASVWPETTAIVTRATVSEAQHWDVKRGSPFQIRLDYEYHVDGHTYRESNIQLPESWGRRSVSRAHADSRAAKLKGSQIKVYYRPGKPSTSRLTPRAPAVLLFMMLIGGTAMIVCGTLLGWFVIRNRPFPGLEP